MWYNNRILYTGKYLLLFYFCHFCPGLQVNLRLHMIGKFQSNCVWVNSRWGKTVCKCTRAKVTRGEINPVHSTFIYTCKFIWNKSKKDWIYHVPTEYHSTLNLSFFRKFAATRNNMVQVFYAPGKTKEFNPFVLYRTFYGAYDETVCIDWTTDSRYIMLQCSF